MAAERTSSVSLRTLNTATVTLALGLVALAGWHVQNPSQFETIQVPSLSRCPLAKCCCRYMPRRSAI